MSAASPALPPAPRLGRAQEAAAFRLVQRQLRNSRAAGPEGQRAALLLLRRLWQGVLLALARPDNTLPEALRQGLGRLAATVLRECAGPRPDLDLLLLLNGQVLAGLAARG
ncbi:flagellar biosynthesis regulator FlaF [Pseudoroseomonas cervicalis]|uniref:flagellar biosynthesis regulator FlaF n=1 Tax=Teichococcus cervicalis TaxID=204525 RepID=UPI002784E9B0|nr:flagellar biosynthesis regulator FlaF [Pseudoroseomonas cervicalis]MDQ1080051.1 hypothetical protein [Pseudoroseomonas cervicalis]